MSPALLLFSSARSINSTGFIVGCSRLAGLVLRPQSRLRFVAVPDILFTGDVAIEHRFVLKLVATEPPGERVLGPDDLAANCESGLLDGVLKLTLPRRRVADVQRSARFDYSAIGSEGVGEEFFELLLIHPVALNLQSVLGVALVRDVIGRIGEDQIRGVACEKASNIGRSRCITTEHFVATKGPEITGDRDGWLGRVPRPDPVAEGLPPLFIREHGGDFVVLLAEQGPIKIIIPPSLQFPNKYVI